MLKNIVYIWLACGIVHLLCIDNAYAYIDPGTGSMLLQVLLAAGVAILTFWRQFKDFFRKPFSDKSVDSVKHDDLE